MRYIRTHVKVERDIHTYTRNHKESKGENERSVTCARLSTAASCVFRASRARHCTRTGVPEHSGTEPVARQSILYSLPIV